MSYCVFGVHKMLSVKFDSATSLQFYLTKCKIKHLSHGNIQGC